MMGKPSKQSAESNSNTIGMLSPISSAMDNITNFCWCLFFIVSITTKSPYQKGFRITNQNVN